MALTTEEQELVLRVHGAAEVERLTHVLEAEENTLRELGEAYQRAAITEAQFEAQVRRTAASMTANTAALAAAKQAAGGAEAGLRGMNATIRNLGFGVSDVFSNNGPLGQKIQGFANNVGNITTGVLQMLGKTGPQAIAAAAGLEVAFTGVGAALTALGIKSTGDFLRLFTGAVKEATGGLGDLQARIEELTGKEHLVPVEVLELRNAVAMANDLKKSLEAVEKLRTGQSHYERESGKAVEQTLAEGGKDDAGRAVGAADVHARLRKDLVNELLATDSKLQAAIKEEAEARAAIEELRSRNPADEAQREGIQAAIGIEQGKAEKARAAQTERQTAITTGSADGKTAAVADTQLGAILDAAEKKAGEQQRLAREALARRLAKAGLGGLAGGVAASSPEDIEEHETVTEGLDDANERAKAARVRRENEEKAARERARNVQADRDREVADAGRDVLQAVGGDVKKDAVMELAGGKTREEVRKRVVTQIRAALDEADQVRAEIRDAVAEAVGGKLATNIQDKDVAAAKASGETKAETDRKAADATQKRQAKAIADPLMKATDVDERAAALVDQVREAGGAVTGVGTAREGFRPMTPEQQQRYIQGEVFKYLRAAGVTAQNAQIASGEVTRKAFGADDLAAVAARAPQPGRGRKGAVRGPAAPMLARPKARAPERKKRPTLRPAAPLTQNQIEAADRAAPPKPKPAPFGPGRAKGMGPAAPDASAAVAPVQGGQAALQGAMATGLRATAQVVRNQATLDARTAALETGFRQLTRAAERAGRTNQSMGT